MQGSYDISYIIFTPELKPSGRTSYIISVSEDAKTWKQSDSFTESNTVSEKVFQRNCNFTNVRYVNIATTESPSCVAWREIEIYGVASDLKYYTLDIKALKNIIITYDNADPLGLVAGWEYDNNWFLKVAGIKWSERNSMMRITEIDWTGLNVKRRND